MQYLAAEHKNLTIHDVVLHKEDTAANESLYAKLKSGAANYDVIIPSDYMVAKMINEGMLAPLDYDNIPNFQKIDAGYRNPDYDPQNAYTVPYWRSTC